MEDLLSIKRQIISDGELTDSDIQLLENKLFDEEGMTRKKADFLFDLKNTIHKDRLTNEFKELFVKAITTYLLEDESSPGEIEESEARWLRAKIQTRGFVDKLDLKLLNNLKRKSINYPEILYFKGKTVRKFESTLFYSRFLAILAVVGSLLSALILFIQGSMHVWKGVVAFVESISSVDTSVSHQHEMLIEAFVSSIDIYLFAMVLIIFGMGIYELFITKIDPVEQKVDSRPSWLQISSIDDLKSSLGKVILMVLIVLFFKHSLNIKYENAADLLFLALGILLLAGALFLANYHGKNKKGQ